jgi:mono/diheme cytochrome c family protein
MLIAGCGPGGQLPPAPTERMAVQAATPMATLERGHRVFLKHCGRCHGYEMPDEVSGPDWHVVVPGMAWNAGISEADEEAVLRYVMAARRP